MDVKRGPDGARGRRWRKRPGDGMGPGEAGAREAQRRQEEEG